MSRPEISIQFTFDESEGSASVYVAPVPALKVTHRYIISLQNVDVAVILTVSLTENEAPTNRKAHSASETVVFFTRFHNTIPRIYELSQVFNYICGITERRDLVQQS